MEIKIIKEKRKTISLKLLDSAHAVVKAPNRMSDAKINEFISEKRSWLDKAAAKLLARETFADEFDLMRFVYLDGKKQFKTEELAQNFNDFSPNKKNKTIMNFYLSKFEDLVSLVQDVSNKSGLEYRKLLPTNSVRVWGTYSSERVMKLNFKLVILPKELQYYVVVHELCHSLHFNHKPKFWASVEKLCPNYKMLKKQLAAYSFVLKSRFI